MEKIILAGKPFVLLIDEDTLQSRVRQLAASIADECRDKNPVFLFNLTGSVFFACDLLRNIGFPCEIYPFKLSSYVNNVSSGTVNRELWPEISLEGRCVVIIEDIIESGCTMSAITGLLREKGCRDYKIATLLMKPQKLKVNLQVDYVGFEIGDEYVAGYGLDVDFTGRNLRAIYKTEC